MTKTVAMLDKSYQRVAKRLDPLGLDIRVIPFDRDGRFQVDGAQVPPEDMAVDYLWLSPHIPSDGLQKMAFDLALSCKAVGVLQTYNAGLDHPFYAEIAAKGTRICKSSAQAVAIAEYVMAHVLSLLHPFQKQRRQQAERVWKVTPFQELSSKRWLIIGYGPIGQEISKRAKAFGSEIAVVRRSATRPDHVDHIGTLARLPNFLPESDIIVLACSLTEETRGLADSQFFKAMKEDAILVNIARGALIDESALIAGLDSGRPAHAVLDVFAEEPLPETSPFWTHPKVRVTPHTSFAGDGGGRRWTQLFLDNIARFAADQPLIHEVDPDDVL